MAVEVSIRGEVVLILSGKEVAFQQYPWGSISVYVRNQGESIWKQGYFSFSEWAGIGCLNFLREVGLFEYRFDILKAGNLIIQLAKIGEKKSIAPFGGSSSY